MHNTLVSRIRAHGVKLQQIPAQTNLYYPSAAGLLRLKLKVFGKQLAKWLGLTVMVIVWWETGSGSVNDGGEVVAIICLSLYFSLSLYLSFSLPLCLSSWREGLGRRSRSRSRSSISSQAPVTTSIAVTLTPPPLSLEHLWACHSPGREGAKEGGRHRGGSVC